MSTRQDPDRELVVRVQAELPYVATGFAMLMRAYQARVLRTCRRLLGNPTDAEDVYQEICIRVFHGLARFEFQSTFSTWLFRITHNECMSWLRRNKRERASLPLSEAVEPIVEDGPDFDSARELERVLSRLSFADREVLTLRFVSDLPLQVIADILGIKLSAAKMRLSRAVERCLQHVDTEADSADAEGGEPGRRKKPS